MNKDTVYPKIVTPKRYVPVLPYDIPIFLAGPVLGGGDWQAEFIEACLDDQQTTINKNVLSRTKFFVPCRWDSTHRLAKHFATVYEERSSGINLLDSQTAWETNYLYIAMRQGLILFGLVEESDKSPRADGNPYAMDTYGEIGRWSNRARVEKLNSIYIATTRNFRGAKTISKNLVLDNFGPNWSESFVKKKPSDNFSYFDSRNEIWKWWISKMSNQFLY